MMIIADGIRISCMHSEFDKWSNSEEMLFDINIKNERNAFIDWVTNDRGKL